MPRYAELPEQMTPFAQLLVDYMWNKRPANRPPLTANQLAIRLNVPKQNVNSWIFRGSLPPFETVMAVLAKLDLTMYDLYSAYQRAGILMPRWDEHDTASPKELANPELATDLRTRKATVVPPTTIPPSAPTAAEPLPYTTPAPPAAESEDWDALVAQTERVLREEGAPEQMIASVVASIRNRQSGKQTPIQRSLIAEHTEPTEPADKSGERQTKTQAHR